MAPTSAQWTLEEMNDAKAKNQFIFVSPEGSSRVTINDATNFWNIDPTIIFQTGYRIAGTPDNITYELLQQGIQEDAIQELLSSAITSDNFLTDLHQYIMKNCNYIIIGEDQ